LGGPARAFFDLILPVHMERLSQKWIAISTAFRSHDVYYENELLNWGLPAAAELSQSIFRLLNQPHHHREQGGNARAAPSGPDSRIIAVSLAKLRCPDLRRHQV
jgi:hypothetical protein